MSRDIGGTPHEGFRYLSDCFPASTLCSLTRYLLLERFVRSCACRLFLLGQKLLYPVCRLTLLLSSVLVVQRLASEASIDCGVNPPEVAQRNRICPSSPLAKQIRGSTPTHSRTAIQSSPREKYFPLMIFIPITPFRGLIFHPPFAPVLLRSSYSTSTSQ
ncbi:hypothetical protein BGZ57DRAFT_527604 [Hyaloscypha finlandica]|nr:hypothetical protein BGZ57DRAFT_527604 [Hyaloscypha finlandica]